MHSAFIKQDVGMLNKSYTVHLNVSIAMSLYCEKSGYQLEVLNTQFLCSIRSTCLSQYITIIRRTPMSCNAVKCLWSYNETIV